MSFTHDHNTRSKKPLSFEDAMEKMENNIIDQISSLKADVNSMKDEFLNMKDVIIKRLQDENELLRARCSKLEDKVVSLETSVNQVEQYGRRNNIVISGIPDDIDDDELEDAVTSIMQDVEVVVQSGDIEACHRIGKSDRKTSSKKTIVRFINRKYCKKALINRKKLRNVNSETKYNFSRNNQIFINENLTRSNESLAFCGRKLKKNGVIHSCFTKDGVVHIKRTEQSKPLKVHHMNQLYDAFPEFEFFEDDGSELYHDASPNVTGQSSY